MKKALLRTLLVTLLLLSVIGALSACGASEFTVTVKDGDTTLKTLTLEKEAAITIDPDDTAFQKAGYEVEGIYTDAAFTTPLSGDALATEDLVLYVKYEPRPFKIIVIDDPNSTSYRQVDVTYNGTYTLTPPTRAGYLFLGYTHVQDGAPVSFPLTGTYTKTNTISISAQWKKLASITVYDELSEEQVGTVIYADAEGNFTLPAVTDTNADYNFGGYVIPGVTLTRQQDGTYTGKVTSDSSMTATRKWTPIPTYLLTVNGLYGDDAMAPTAYKTGEAFTLPAAPTRAGYFFMGYTVNGEALTLDNGAGTFTWTEAVTVTANWKRQATISVYNGTTLVETIKVPQNGAYTLTAQNDTATHTFGGFTCKGQAFAASGTYTDEEDLTVMQVWNLIPTYTLTVNGLYGDDVMAPASYKTGDEFTLPVAPERDGYVFLGYKVNGAPLTVGADGKVTFTWTAATTVTAEWQARVYITVRDERTGATVGTVEVVNGAYDLSALIPAEGDRVVVEADKTYTYLGLVLNGNAFAVSGTDYTGGSVTVTRDWNGVDRVFIDVVSKGAVFDFAPVEVVDGEYTALTTPTLDGYYFLGFFTDEACTVAFANDGEYDGTTDLTVYAKWRRVASIKVFNGATLVETVTVDQNGAYTLTAQSDTATHTFGGFVCDGEAFAASGTYTGEADLTVMQVWNLIPTYTLTVNGLDGAPASYKTGATYTLPTAPERAGYYFLGYTMGGEAFAASGTFTWSEDITVTANWRRVASIKVYKDGALKETVTVDKDGKYTLTVPSNTDDEIFNGFTQDGMAFTATGTYTGEADLTVIQVWTAILKFNWTLDANGGAFATGAVTSGTAAESTKVSLPTPERDGYTFLGYTYGDGTLLEKDGDLYVLPAYSAVQAKALKLVAKWEIGQNVTGEQFDSEGNSREFFREENGGELIYVFLTGREYTFGGTAVSFGGGYASVITPVKDGETVIGFRAVAPGTFTMTQNGVTLTCRVEYYVGSAGVGTNTAERLEANFKGGIDTVLEAGIKGFAPDIVGGTVALDKIPYTVLVKKGETVLAAGSDYEILPNGQIDFNAALIGETLTLTYVPEYALKGDNVSVTVTVKLNNGVNVYTNDELYAAYADLSVNTINLLRNIKAALQPQHYTVNEYGLLVHNDDYLNGVYLRAPLQGAGADSITINGNCYKIDASGIPAINPELQPGEDDRATWSDGYTGLNESHYQLVNVQVGIFGYCYAYVRSDGTIHTVGDSATQPGGTLYMNDLFITGNEYEITRTITDPNAKTYWEKTYPVVGKDQVVVASSGATHGIIIRQTNAVLDNVKIEHTQTALFADGYSTVIEDSTEVKRPGTPAALLTSFTLNNTIVASKRSGWFHSAG